MARYNDINKHIVQRDGITYYMTDEEFEHADEWIQAIKDETNFMTIHWEDVKEKLYKKWREGKNCKKV